MKPEGKQAVDQFLASAQREFAAFAASLSADTYADAVRLIRGAQAKGGRVHVTGIGKPGHIAGYAASLLSSTGTPTYFLHGTEAVHGSCGQLVAGDVVLCVSNSGETGELKATVLAIANNNCQVLGISGNPDSWLAQHSQVHLFAGVTEEGGPLNRAPRNSILAETLTIQALSAALQGDCGQNPQEYVRCHPGGKLGELRKDEV